MRLAMKSTTMRLRSRCGSRGRGTLDFGGKRCRVRCGLHMRVPHRILTRKGVNEARRTRSKPNEGVRGSMNASFIPQLIASGCSFESYQAHHKCTGEVSLPTAFHCRTYGRQSHLAHRANLKYCLLQRPSVSSRVYRDWLGR
jgi:hypothetical protein